MRLNFTVRFCNVWILLVFVFTLFLLLTEVVKGCERDVCPTEGSSFHHFLWPVLSTAHPFHPKKSLFRLPSCGVPGTQFLLCVSNRQGTKYIKEGEIMNKVFSKIKLWRKWKSLAFVSNRFRK